MLVQAGDVLEGRLLSVRAIQEGAGRLFAVTTDRGESGIFMEKDGAYVRLNSGSELVAINEILRGYRFTRHHFDNPLMVNEFLSNVMYLHRGPHLVLGSSINMMHPSAWLRGIGEGEALLKELSRDPEFQFEGNRWKVTFNGFRADGAVDQWSLVGRHNPETNTNEILRIDVISLKATGTFNYRPQN